MADFSLSAEITGNAKGFTTAINESLSSLDKLNKNIGKATSQISESFKSWGVNLEQFYSKGSGIFKNFGLDLDKFASHFGVSGAVISGIVAGTVALANFGEEMNQARANIAKGTGAIGKDLDKLQDDFQNALLAGIGMSIDELSNVMADINTRFGLTGEALVSMTDDIDKFANITGTNGKTAVKEIADVMSKWNIATEDANSLMQQLSMASKISGASVTELSTALKSGQATFSQFGMSGTQSLAFLSSLAKNGIESSVALQGLKTALVKFTAEGKNAKQGLAEVSEKIKNASSDSEAMNIAIETFGSKAGVEMVKVLKNGSASTEEFAEALRNAVGSMEATNEASRTMKDAFADLKNVVKGTFEGLGSGVNDFIRDFIDSFTLVAQEIGNVLAPVFNIIGDLISHSGKMIKLTIQNFYELREKLGISFDGVAKILVSLRDNIKHILSNVFDIFQAVFNAIFAILDGNWRLAWLNVKLIMQKTADIIFRILSSIVNVFKDAFNQIIKVINKAIDLYNELPDVVKIFGDINKVKLIPNVNLSQATGLASAIESTEQEIEVLSGKAAKKVIGDLGTVKDEAIATTGTIGKNAEVQKMKL